MNLRPILFLAPLLLGADETEGLTPAELQAQACATVPHNGFRRKVAYATGSRRNAIPQAYSEARQKMLVEVTAGFSDLRRAAVERHIVDWKHEYENRRACASVELEVKHIDSFERESQDLERDIAALAKSIVDAMGEDPLLQIKAPVWANSGCVSEVGRYLISELRNQLARQPGQLALLPPRQRSWEAVELSTVLTPGAGTVVVSASLRPPGAVGATPLPGFSFPNDLLMVEEGERGQCHSDALIGVQGDGPTMSVQLALDTNDGQICEGGSIEPLMRLSHPAHVRIFSIDGQGDTLLIYPPPGPDPKAPVEMSLGTFQALRLDSGDEKLVVVAAPEATALGPLEDKRGFCRLDGGLQPGLFGQSVAMTSISYRVNPSGTGACAAVEDADEKIKAARAALEAVEPCTDR
ncbi:MAG: hypothetical protein AAFV53_35120 [Myxococcota bacterium]